ncbi:MAG: hypothetical protein HZC42_00835 [Candidatus Eisenbacteria bacterium]|nr:hypothetical protein [Candidatus Eisenbacteria bacterium]
MDCASFERWLDEGSPGARAREAQAHAGACPRCAAAHAVALELDALLAAPPAAPAGLADRVMARIERAREARARVPAIAAAGALPWWVRVAAEPAAALALVLAGLLLWTHDLAVALSAGALAGASRWLAGVASGLGDSIAAGGLPAVPHVWTEPVVVLGLAVALAPALAWAGLGLYRWSEALAQPRARRA